MENLIKPLSSDSPMWDMWLSMYHLATITVADELGLFKEIHVNEISIDQLAKKLNIDKRGIEALCNVLISLGFIKKEDELLKLTPVAETYLIPSQPFYWGNMLEQLKKRNEHVSLISVLKDNSYLLSFDKKSFSKMWEGGEISPEAAEAFTHCMHATIFAPAVSAVKSNVFKDTKNLLDMGGGSGCFSIAYTKEYPGNKATVFELPVVCHVTQKYLDKFEIKQEISLFAGNFFKDAWPRKHDGILFSQIFHDWPPELCQELAKLAYEALEPGGKVFIHEMLLDQDKSSPLTTACFDLLMYINHRSQQFNQKDLTNLLLNAGFKNPTLTKTFGYYSVLSAIK